MAVLLRIPGVAFIADAYGSMHRYVTATVKTAGVESAGIDALLIEAGLVVRALGVLRALWNRFYGTVRKLNLVARQRQEFLGDISRNMSDAKRSIQSITVKSRDRALHS